MPTGGKYGQIAVVAEMIESLGLKLAWSHVWECFCLYATREDGRIRDHFHFRRPIGDTIIPVTPIWFEVFRYLRERWPHDAVREAMLKQHAKDKYEAQQEREQEAAALRAPVMDGVALDMGMRTPKAQIIVPGWN